MRSCLPIVFACVALLGCVDNDASSFFVSGQVKPSEGDCLLEPGNPLVSRGVFDLERGFDYTVHPLYNNQLRNRGSDAPLRSDPNGVLITSAEIELQDAAGLPIDFGDAPNPFSVPASDYVPSTDDPKSPSQSVGSITVIPAFYADALAGTFGDTGVVVASVRVFGETTGGVDIESNEWSWPIDVCRGCLFVCMPPGSMDEVECCTPGQDELCEVPCP